MRRDCNVNNSAGLFGSGISVRSSPFGSLSHTGRLSVHLSPILSNTRLSINVSNRLCPIASTIPKRPIHPTVRDGRPFTFVFADASSKPLMKRSHLAASAYVNCDFDSPPLTANMRTLLLLSDTSPFNFAAVYSVPFFASFA